MVETTERADSNIVNTLLENANSSTKSPVILQYLLKAQNYLEKENNPLTLFDIYTRIGKIYQSEDLNDRALPIFQKANRLPSPPISKLQKIELMDFMAKAYFAEGSIDSALLVYDQQLAYFEKENNHEGVLKTLQEKVNVFLDIQNYRMALDLNQQIKSLVEDKGSDDAHLAIINNNIGYNFNFLNEHDRAIKYFLLALDAHKKGVMSSSNNPSTKLDLTILYTNIGITYNNLDDPKNAIKFLQQAIKANNPKSSRTSNAYLQHLIASIYLNHGDVYNALQFNDLAIINAKRRKDFPVLSNAYNTAAEIQKQLYDYELALDFYQKHFAIRDSLTLEDRFRKQQLLQTQLLLEKSEKEIKLLLINEQIKDQAISSLQIEKKFLASEADKLKLEAAKISLEADQHQKELLLLKNEQEIKDANLLNSKLEAQKANQELEVIQIRLLAEKKDREIEVAKQQQKFAEMETASAESEKRKAEQEAELSKKNQNIAELQLEQAKTFRQFIYGLGTLLALVFIMILSAWYYARVANQRLAAKNKEIEEERRKSENLLLNILPLETANELKLTGIATPREYAKVTVLFADFSNFTKISEQLSAEQLIHELNDCFRAFDEITEQNGLEKIKTIGDGYMCAGGIPVANETNPTDAINAAIEMQKFMQQRVKEKNKAGIPYWNMRIGIHTGHVIAGVVGTKKFAYDIWGDTVNIASRMETSCDNGKINISASTRGFVNGVFEYDFRGEVEVKHGNKVGMYFVS
ncbi:MAG: adenylate/guanylate cyclase domain-containing protein [Saprospiraceae bacterium]